MKHWPKVFGALGAICISLTLISEMPVLWIKIFTVLGTGLPNIGLLFARQNNVSSEEAGAIKQVPIPKSTPTIP